MSRPPSPTPPLPIITTSAPSENHNFSSPPRSSTLPQKQTTSKHHHHHHPHRSHHHHRHDKSVPQSAIERTVPNPFGDLLRGEWPRQRGSGSSEAHPPPPSDSLKQTSRDPSDFNSTRESLLRNKALASNELAEKQRQQWNEVARLQRRRQEGETSLKQTLTHLSDLSTQMTRRLDYTYYSLLRSLSHLTSSVNDFYALAQASRNMHEGFLSSTGEMEREGNASLKATNETLDRQAERLGQLQGRMKKGRVRVAELCLRLESVRSSIEEAERREGEERRKTGKILTICWGCAASWLAILVLGLLMRQFGPRPVVRPSITEGIMADVAVDSRNWSGTAPKIAGSAVNGQDDASGEGAAQSSAANGADATLRLLDEL